jgi:hypothetical protein
VLDNAGDFARLTGDTSLYGSEDRFAHLTTPPARGRRHRRG